MKSIKSILPVILLLLALQSKGQSEPEYRMELGAGIGIANYIGDFNGSLVKNFQPSASLVARRVINPYMGVKVNAMYGKMKGSTKNVKTYYPDYVDEPYEFSNTLIDLSATYEYNFWPYGTGKDYRGAKRLTPFVFAGIGLTYVHGGGQNVFTGNVPLGLGVKYKIGQRLNLGLEWAIHFSMSDKLDGVKDPYYVKSSGLFKNTDCYSALQLTLTYSFWAKCRVCHNQDE